MGLSCSPCVANIVDWLVPHVGRALEMFLISLIRTLSKSWTQALTLMCDDRQPTGLMFCWVGHGTRSVVQPSRQGLSDHGGVLIMAEPWQPSPTVI